MNITPAWLLVHSFNKKKGVHLRRLMRRLADGLYEGIKLSPSLLHRTVTIFLVRFGPVLAPCERIVERSSVLAECIRQNLTVLRKWKFPA